jgi:hypothetical protein
LHDACCIDLDVETVSTEIRRIRPSGFDFADIAGTRGLARVLGQFRRIWLPDN